MSRHRAQPARRRAPASPHRHAQAQPRYGRIGVVVVSATVCLVALLGGVGVLPSVAGPGDDGSGTSDVARDPAGTSEPADTADKAVIVLDSAQDEEQDSEAPSSPTTAEAPPEPPDDTLPADSGEGYRVVFSEDRQRVWLVDEDDRVERTYLVSGSLYDNLDPGTYEVYSRSEQAYAFDGSGSMKYFVRFAEGDTGAAIGFHDIPVDNAGDLVQTVAQLGTPQSHGCIRQERDDAIALWDFTEVGTTVVVV
jgi:hypothetical protein